MRVLKNIVLLIIITFLLACNKEKLPAENKELTLADNTVVVDAEKLTFISAEDGTIVFREIGDGQNIEVNDIIITEQNGGLILEVNSIEHNNDLIKLNTSQSYLNRAVKHFKYNNEYKFDIGSSKKNNSDIKLKKGVSLSGGGISLKEISLFKNSAGAKVEITDGNIEFNPNIHIDWKIGFFELLEFETYAKGDLAFDLEILVTSSADMKLKDEIVLASFTQTQIQFAGPIPIVEVIKLDFIAGYELDHFHNADISTGFESDYYVKVGAEYEKGSGWSKIWDQSLDFEMYPFEFEELSLKTDIKAYVKPKLTITLYGLAGPGIDTRPYLNFIGNAEKVSSSINWDWELKGGIDAHLLFVLGVFEDAPEFSYELFDENTIIASDSGSDVSFAPIAILKLIPESGDVSTNFTFDGSLTTDKDHDINNLQFRFDINGDGIFETDWQREPTFQGNYGQFGKGNYNVVMEVKDPKGEKSTIQEDLIIYQ